MYRIKLSMRRAAKEQQQKTLCTLFYPSHWWLRWFFFFPELDYSLVCVAVILRFPLLSFIAFWATVTAFSLLILLFFSFCPSAFQNRRSERLFFFSLDLRCVSLFRLNLGLSLLSLLLTPCRFVF